VFLAGSTLISSSIISGSSGWMADKVGRKM